MLTVQGMTELQAAAVLFRDCGAPIKKAMQQEAKTWTPTLIRSAQAHARGEVQKRIAQSARPSVTNKGPKVSFGASGRVTGSPLGKITRPYEFGTDDRNKKTTYLSRQRTSKKAMRVNRRTMRQLPARNADGHFLYPAVAATVPDLVGRYVRAIAGVMSSGR